MSTACLPKIHMHVYTCTYDWVCTCQPPILHYLLTATSHYREVHYTYACIYYMYLTITLYISSYMHCTLIQYADSTQVVITSTNEGAVSFTNSAFWGASNQIAKVNVHVWSLSTLDICLCKLKEICCVGCLHIHIHVYTCISFSWVAVEQLLLLTVYLTDGTMTRRYV